MCFGTDAMLRRCMDIVLEYRGNVIEKANSFKYLGIQLDPKLSFHDHVEYIYRKMVPRLKMLAKIRNITGQGMSMYLYKALLLPILDYGDIIFDCLMQRDNARLQSLQNSALHIVLRADRRMSVMAMHRELNVDLLENR